MQQLFGQNNLDLIKEEQQKREIFWCFFYQSFSSAFKSEIIYYIPHNNSLVLAKVTK